MSGICFLLKIKLIEKDYEILNMIQKLVLECDNIDHKKEQLTSINQTSDSQNKDNNIIQKCPDLQQDFNIPFTDFISSISKRGLDYFNISSIKEEDNIIINIQDKVEKMTYKEIFEYLNNNKEIIILNSFLDVLNTNNIKNKSPFYDEKTKNIMQFNGEIYNINKEIINKPDENKNIITTNHDKFYKELLFELLNNFSMTNKSNDEKYIQNFFKLYNNIESDHSLYFYDNINNNILISRDIFGKRSIILCYIKSTSILILTPVLSETLINLHKENPKDIYILEIPSNYLFFINRIENLNQNLFLYKNSLMPDIHLIRFNNNISNKITLYNNLTSEIHELLRKSIKKRLNKLFLEKNKNINLGITFSGGLDSTLISYYVLLETPEYINIDLFNLSFDKLSPDRITGIISYKELIDKFPNRKINLILIDREFNKDITQDFQKYILNLIYPRKTHMDFNIATAKNISTCKKGYLVDKEKLILYFKDIDNKIINENLISKVEEKTYQNNILTKKIDNFNYEKFTDFSKEYISNAKIFFDGLGADEIFGGYLRYKNGDIENQMSKDFDRLWLRNCGRDDRVCGENQIELRFPYLDIDLMNFLSRIEEIKQVVDFTKPRGEGEKYLLRRVAKEIVGLKLSHNFEKRAIQFGTKIAHHTNVNKYGSNNKANGKAQFE